MKSISDLIFGLELVRDKFGEGTHLYALHNVLCIYPDKDAFSGEEQAELESRGWRFDKQNGWYMNI